MKHKPLVVDATKGLTKALFDDLLMCTIMEALEDEPDHDSVKDIQKTLGLKLASEKSVAQLAVELNRVPPNFGWFFDLADSRSIGDAKDIKKIG